MFLQVAGILSPVLDWGRISVSFAMYPVVRPLAKVKNFISVAVRLSDLAARNDILNQQVEKLTADLAVSEKARQDNRFLREALGFKNETHLNAVPAEVITWDPLSFEPVVTLNRGERQGVGKGAAVVISGNILVGVISEVFAETSTMEVLTSSKTAVNAEVIPSGVRGIVRGEHGLGLTFDLVSQNEVIQPGDMLVTSGLGGQYPKSLLIGKIGKISSSESELFQKAGVVPATNLRNLRFVFVVKK